MLNGTNPDLPAQREVLQSLEPLVRELMQRHRDSRKLWMPADLLPADEQNDVAHDQELNQLRARVRGLPDGLRVALALNLLTEEGLPHFHRLVAVYMGYDGAWAEWNNLWTAEEDRHGCILRDYVRDARVSAEVITFRPFYIIGEVNNPGQYPYANGMTATTAVAMAGGYTYRGRQDYILVTRGNDPEKIERRAPINTRVLPDDVVRIPERLF